MKRILLSLLLCASVHAECLPDAPTSLAAYVPIPPPGSVGIQAVRVLVVWSDVRTERGYRVERAPWTVTGWGPFVTLGELPRNSTAFTDWQPLGGLALYRVSAVNPCGAAANLFVYQP